MGHKRAPYYRIVVTDNRNKREGRFIETVGTYHPVAPDRSRNDGIQRERVEYWLSVGAQPSETVWSILKKSGIAKPIRNRKKKDPSKAKGQSEAVNGN
jgi:small subunit ribosomal protein S16